MNLTQVILYGGLYREEWDEAYRLKIKYENMQGIAFRFFNGTWQPVDTDLPQLPLSELYFPQAASAAIASARFIASGQTAQDFSLLTPDGCCGAIFAAECLRILMDNYGLRLETVYPFVAPCIGQPLKEKELKALSVLQPRTFHVLQLLQNMYKNEPYVRHDIRLQEYRKPIGSVPAGSEIRLAFRSSQGFFQHAFLELFGDDLSLEYEMTEYEEGWRVMFRAPDIPAALWYRFRLESEQGTRWLCTAPDGIHSWLRNSAHDGFRLTVAAPDFKTPLWFQNSVMYQVFPDRFAFSDDDTAERGIHYHKMLGQSPELHLNRRDEVKWKARANEKDYIPDDFFGGTLNGIRNKLPYLKDLGITCLYLNPIVEARSNHRYDTSDYLRVDPILGSNEDFRTLCREASENGIRILCDGVFSHTGADSIYFNRDGHYPNPGACQKEKSPYDSWYEFRKFPDDYRSWWGFQELPEVNEDDPGWREYVVTGPDSVVRQWLRRGASGWRLDVADELPDEVLELIRSAAKEESPDNVILGEVWEDAILKESYGARRKYALGRALDSVMNYPFRTAVLNYLHGYTDAFQLSDFLTSQQMHYPKPLYLSLMNLVGTHDVERVRTNLAVKVHLKELTREEQLSVERELTDGDWEKADRLLRLAAAIQFSIPGVPSIYYGDEVGMTGTNDPFNRRPYLDAVPGSSEAMIHDYVRALCHKRLQHSTLRNGNAFFLAADADVLLILRIGEENILTVINRDDLAHRYELDLPGIAAEGEISACSALIRIL